ncbi:hypothetical protein [Bradyrhizobium sp. LTSP857]|uniref:hypothetical protein n=1 Tax=Bradyrhizobium sp. LTSP857 TaxID=1619231 RepID=UPI000679737A|nr:hypothetical protein [Bradyrhizobium sp. LTSP857]
MKGILPLVIFGILIATAPRSLAQQGPDQALQRLNECVATPRAKPSTQEDIFKSFNPAISDPDRVSWCLFLYVSSGSATAGNNNALFETWASDGETFNMNPQWPTTPTPKVLRPNILLQIRESDRVFQLGKQGRAFQPFVLPPPRPLKEGDNLEETRRNKIDFDFIVSHDLHKISGLQKAFETFTRDRKLLSFPADAIEVKANWFPVLDPQDPTKSGIPGYTGSPADAGKFYHVNTAAGKQYALVSMHLISKMVPNWTWATFEHRNNPGRCEYIGCHDSFGSTHASVAPDTTIPDPSDPSYQNPANNPKPYPVCTHTPALASLFKEAQLDPAFQLYCLKGSQTDFTDATGMAIRLGNSITEETFDFQSSCMTCHSRAAFGADGSATTIAGFDNTTGAPLGPVHGEWYWTTQIGGPWGPAALPVVAAGQIPAAFSADFVWSIPFCAVDDTSKPVAKSRCAAK